MAQPAPIFRIIPFDNLVDSVDQDRIRVAGLDMDHVVRLALSIRGDFGRYPSTLGLYPNDLPLVQANGKGTYILKIGYHRKAACRLLADGGEVTLSTGETVTFEPDGRWAAGLPCIIAEHDDNTLAAVGSNVAQKALNPIEQASAARLLQDQGKSLAEIAAIFGKSEPAMSNLMRLLKLPHGIKKLIAEGVLTERHGRALLPLTAIPGCLEEYAANSGQDLWTTNWSSTSGVIGPLPGSDKLWLFNVAHTEFNVEQALNRHTRALTSRHTDWPTDWDLGKDEDDGLLTEDDYAPAVLGLEGHEDAFQHETCQACAFAVKLSNRDDHLSCVNLRCWEARSILWRRREIARQMPAVRAWCDANNVPLNRIVTDEKPPYTWRVHGDYDAPKELIQGGHCGGACDCLRVVYKPDETTRNAQRPDAKRAPDFVLMCSNGRRLTAKRNALAKKTGAPVGGSTYTRRNHAIAQVIRHRQQRLMAEADLTPAALAGNARLLQRIAHYLTSRWGDPPPLDTPEAMWRTILAALIKGIRGNEDYTSMKSLDEVTALLADLGVQTSDDDLLPIRRVELEDLLEQVTEFATHDELYEYKVRHLEENFDEIGDLAAGEERDQLLETLRACLALPEHGEGLHARLQKLIDRLAPPTLVQVFSRQETHIRRDRRGGNLCGGEGETYVTVRAAQIRRQTEQTADLCPACLAALDGVPE